MIKKSKDNTDTITIFIKELKKKFPNITKEGIDKAVKKYLDSKQKTPINKMYSYCPIINATCIKRICMFYSVGIRIENGIEFKAPICLLGRTH